jgi:putative phage-type endonuclease
MTDPAIDTFGRAVAVHHQARLAEVDRAAWLKLRRKGLGGSDLPPLMGVYRNRWSPQPDESELAVYCEKVDKSEPSGEPFEIDNIPASHGTFVEPYVARLYEQETGLVTARVPMLQHPKALWRLGSIDRVACRVNAAGELIPVRGVELKAPDAFNSAWYGGQIPAYVECQCNWYMHITGTDAWDLAILRGSAFNVVTLRRDDKLIARMVAAGSKLWHEHVLAGVEPDPAPHEVAAWVAERWPETTVEERESTPEEDDLAERMGLCDERINVLKLRKDQLQAKMLKRLDGAEVIRGPWGSFSYREKTGGTSWKAAAKDLADELALFCGEKTTRHDLLSDAASQHRGAPKRSPKLTTRR